MTTNKNLGIEVKPEFIKIFRESNSVSASKGKTYFLARSKRRVAEKIEDYKRSDSEHQDKNRTSVLESKEIDYMDKLKSFEEKVEENSKYKDCLAKIYEKWVINSDGECIENDSNAEKNNCTLTIQ